MSIRHWPTATIDCYFKLTFMKIGFVSLYGPGHFNPMSAIARQLDSRNHNVVMISLPFIEPLARAANLPFISFGGKNFPDSVSAEIVGTMGRLKGGQAREFAINAIAKAAKVRRRELPEQLSANGIDALVLDSYDAVKFQQAIAKTNGLSRAADLLEEGFGLTKKCRE
jgi:hypothetical protein